MRCHDNTCRHHDNIAAKAVAPAGAAKASAVPGATKTTAKDAPTLQTIQTDSPMELKVEDLTPFPCNLPEQIIIDILTHRLVGDKLTCSLKS